LLPERALVHSLDSLLHHALAAVNLDPQGGTVQKVDLPIPKGRTYDVKTMRRLQLSFFTVGEKNDGHMVRLGESAPVELLEPPTADSLFKELTGSFAEHMVSAPIKAKNMDAEAAAAVAFLSKRLRPKDPQQPVTLLEEIHVKVNDVPRVLQILLARETPRTLRPLPPTGLTLGGVTNTAEQSTGDEGGSSNLPIVPIAPTKYGAPRLLWQHGSHAQDASEEGAEHARYRVEVLQMPERASLFFWKEHLLTVWSILGHDMEANRMFEL
jgi:hypothetical protein